MSATARPTRVEGRAPRTGRQTAGLVLAGLLCLLNLPSVLTPTPDGETGPPFVVLVAGTVLGVVGLVALVMAWRTGNRAALRVLAACLVVMVLTAVPGLFVPIPALIKTGDRRHGADDAGLARAALLRRAASLVGRGLSAS